jgi:hypothetical protein
MGCVAAANWVECLVRVLKWFKRRMKNAKENRDNCWTLS